MKVKKSKTKLVLRYRRFITHYISSICPGSLWENIGKSCCYLHYNQYYLLAASASTLTVQYWLPFFTIQTLISTLVFNCIWSLKQLSTMLCFKSMSLMALSFVSCSFLFPLIFTTNKTVKILSTITWISFFL